MRGLLIALTFLTRIPLPSPNNVTQDEFTRSQHYYPVVGLIFGLLLWGLGLISINYYPPLITGAILLISELVLSGGIHLDGYMDSMDGLLSARTPERMLEIMKDSRVGAHAVMSVIGLLLLKFSLLASLSPLTLKLLIIMPMLSRWAFLIGVIKFPYARAQGLGKGFHESSGLLLFLLEGLIISAFSVWLTGIAGLAAVIISVVFVLIFSWKITSLLGGLTGDIYGATIELTEVIALLAAFGFM